MSANENDINLLIEGCRKGDENAQQQLYMRYSPMLYGLCLRYASSSSDADDILVESFIKIFRSINYYRDTSPFESWLSTIAIRTAIDFYRRSIRSRVVFNSEMVRAHEQFVDENDLLDNADLLCRALATLDPIQRFVVNMIAVDGYNYSEVAIKLRRPYTSIKSIYYRSCEKLRTVIEQLESGA